MKNRVKTCASVDLGTTKVSAMIAEMIEGRPRVIGVGTAPSAGMKQGVVVDIPRAAGAIRSAVRESERMAGVSVAECRVGAAGEHIRSMNSRGVVAIADIDEEITGDDVIRALAASRKFSLPYDREIIHTLPQEYIVDKQRGIRQPAGMYGARLEARVHVVTASRPALDNVAKAFELARVPMGELVLEPLASARSVLTDDEREMGCMLLDIGGGTTDVMVYVDGGVVASGVIGIGGNDVTGDVAYGLRTSHAQAEEIKIRFGGAVYPAGDADELIEVVTTGNAGRRRVARHLLAGIIEPRVTELFALIDRQLTGSGLKQRIGGGVVLTGGSSMLRGICDVAEQVFDLPARIGHPVEVDGLAEIVGHPRFATGVGLLHDHRVEPDEFPRPAILARRWLHSLNQLKRAIASFI